MENYFEHLLAPDGNQELASSIINIFEELEYGLVRVKVNGTKMVNIQIMAENDQHTMSFEDCESLYEDYSLEISSPGIERPLTREKDFNVWSDNFVKIKLKSGEEFPRKFKAKLLGYSENKVKIFMENEKEFNGEYLLDPLAIKEIILSWVTKDPPKPNLVS